MKNIKNIVYENRLFLIIVICVLTTICGCRKLVEVQSPPTSLTNGSVFNSDATAIGVLTAFYPNLASGPPIDNSAVYLGLAGDEFSLVNPTGSPLPQYYTNNLVSSGSFAGTELWTKFYGNIYLLNEAIQGLNTSSGLTPAVKQQLTGEALFLRALFYFQLTNLYGDVPIILTTDYKKNQSAARNAQSAVYDQIKSDLTNAQNLLTKNFTDGTLVTISSERLRPTYWAATFLLAKVYLYNKEWANAEKNYTVLVENTSNFNLSTLDSTFLRAGLGNKEAIWQLQPTSDVKAPTPEGQYFILTTLLQNSTSLSESLLQAFEGGDNRKTHWVNSAIFSGKTYYYPFKYKIKDNSNTSEYSTMFRLGEVYLSRAEARAQLNEANAVDDLNKIRNRAGLANYLGSKDQTSLLKAIYHERQVELFGEFGRQAFTDGC